MRVAVRTNDDISWMDCEAIISQPGKGFALDEQMINNDMAAGLIDVGANLHELGERKLHGAENSALKKNALSSFTVLSTSESASIPKKSTQDLTGPRANISSSSLMRG